MRELPSTPALLLLLLLLVGASERPKGMMASGVLQGRKKSRKDEG